MNIPAGVRHIMVSPREQVAPGRVGVYGRTEWSEFAHGPRNLLKSGKVVGWDRLLDPDIQEETEVIFNPVHACKVRRDGKSYLSVPTEHVFGEYIKENKDGKDVSKPDCA